MNKRSSSSQRAVSGHWIPRIVILGALGATIWFAGPTAYAVLSAPSAGDPGPADDQAAGARLDVSRMAVQHAPAWLRGRDQRPILESVLIDLEPILHGEVRLDDPAAVAAWKAKLAASPWVAAVRYPPAEDSSEVPRLGVELDLRRPEIAVVGADRTVVYLVDRDGIVLPPPVRPPARAAIPRVVPPGPVDGRRYRLGQQCRDPAVLAAVAVAFEWRTLVAPGCKIATNEGPPSSRRAESSAPVGSGSTGVPVLLEVDAGNLGGAFLGDPRYSEVAVALAGRGDAIVWMQYGRAEADGGVISAQTKARVLAEVLTAYPDLEYLAGGDLRLRNRWRDCLVQRGR